MPADPISRRRFIVVGGVAVGGLAAAGLARLARPEIVDTAASPLPTSPGPGPASTTIPTSTIPAPPTSEPTTTSAAPTTTAPPQAVPVICKEAWGANPPNGEFTRHTIEQITVHHTAVMLDTNAAAPNRVRQHQAYHQGQGWPDLAYHFIIDANGHIYEGRPLEAVGDTATNYDPTGHLLICCEGDFNRQQATIFQYDSLIGLLAWGAGEFGVKADEIRGHREVADTTCPGDNLFASIADGSVARDVGTMAADGGRTLDMLCGEAAVATVAAIENGEI